MKMLIVQASFSVLTADGVINEKETDLLTQIGKGLGMTEEKFTTVIAGLMIGLKEVDPE